MRIYFDTTRISDDYIIELKQSAKLFTDSFYLGSTLCRAVTLKVDKQGVSTQPSVVYIKDDSDNNLFTLVIDSCNDEDDFCYTYSLTDKMVNLNTVYQVVSGTVGSNVNAICDLIGSAYPIGYYLESMGITWTGDENMTARNFISYVAEVNGGFARLNNDGNLEFVPFSSTSVATIHLDECSDFKLGEYHSISKVKYLTAECGDSTGETLELNSENILFSDEASVSIADIVNHIGSIINGFDFYCIKVSECTTSSVIAPGCTITIGTYKTIAQIDWSYSGTWIGGYELDINTNKQESTEIVDTNKQIKNLKLTLNRDKNEITALVNDLTTNTDSSINNLQTQITQNANSITNNASNISTVQSDLATTTTELNSTIQQTASDITTTISNVKTTVDGNTSDLEEIKTNIKFDTDGITVGKSTSDIRGQFTNDALNFIDELNNKLAWLSTQDGLGATELSVGDATTYNKRWRLITSSDGSHFRITRHQ